MHGLVFETSIYYWQDQPDYNMCNQKNICTHNCRHHSYSHRRNCHKQQSHKHTFHDYIQTTMKVAIDRGTDKRCNGTKRNLPKQECIATRTTSQHCGVITRTSTARETSQHTFPTSTRMSTNCTTSKYKAASSSNNNHS